MCVENDATIPGLQTSLFFSRQNNTSSLDSTYAGGGLNSRDEFGRQPGDSSILGRYEPQHQIVTDSSETSEVNEAFYLGWNMLKSVYPLASQCGSLSSYMTWDTAQYQRQGHGKCWESHSGDWKSPNFRGFMVSTIPSSYCGLGFSSKPRYWLPGGSILYISLYIYIHNIHWLLVWNIFYFPIYWE